MIYNYEFQNNTNKKKGTYNLFSIQRECLYIAFKDSSLDFRGSVMSHFLILLLTYIIFSRRILLNP